jgi:hypothetical protein
MNVSYAAKSVRTNLNNNWEFSTKELAHCIYQEWEMFSQKYCSLKTSAITVHIIPIGGQP